jgi:DNA-binding PadR family transcriptional regulator
MAGATDRKKAASARKAAAEARKVAKQAGERAPSGRPSDVFGGELRRRDVFTLLIFHLISNSDSGASYGNQLIDQVAEITEGSITLNPNTMYPLLRTLESNGYIEGHWEHPQKRSRRLYKITAAGTDEYQRLKQGLEPFLDSIVRSIGAIKREIYGH